MSLSTSGPFQRVLVDHLFHGTTRVWWVLDRLFSDPPPHEFQLQVSDVGHEDALDWTNVGLPGVNVTMLEDGGRRAPAGKVQTGHYRVVLTTPRGRYLSPPAPVWGTLSSMDWRLAREIVRKERLRLSRTGVPGWLLRRFRYGPRSTKATDPLTGEIVDSQHPGSWGTAFSVGYHPPVACELETSPEQRVELRGQGEPSQYSSRPAVLTGRMLSMPDVLSEDVWVHATTDERYSIVDRTVLAAHRGYPLIVGLRLSLLPFDDVVYRIPVSPLSRPWSVPAEQRAVVGAGCIPVDHDYGGEDALAYVGEDCCPVEGAVVEAFRRQDWDEGRRGPEYVVAETRTTSGGRWAQVLRLDPGEYVLRFHKPGRYGPDVKFVTASPPEENPFGPF